jgi:putative ABC transport system permease protein
MILWRAGFRNVLQHPWQTVLAIIGVALGVCVVTAVDLANESAHRAFRIAAETVAGRATHQLIGGPAGLPDEFYRTLRVTHGIRRNAPVVEGYVQVAGRAGSTLRLIGIDPFAEPPIRAFSSHFSSGKVLEALIGVPGTGMLLRQTAERLGIDEGGNFIIEAQGSSHPLTLAGFLAAEDELSRLGLDSVLVTDIATAQELLAMEGRLSRIDLVIPEGDEGANLLKEIRSTLPEGATIVPAGSRAGALDQMTRAFRLNLFALSLLALVVGMFLIYNITSFSVIRRRRLIGLLRAIGVTRREIFALICTEALLISLAGTGLGLLLGVLLGEELTRLVTRTINDLYFVLEVRSVALLPQTLVKGILLGIGATLAAAVPPALEATSAPPRAVLSRSNIEARRRRNVPLTALAGLLTICAGGGLLLVEAAGINGSFAGLFFVIIGYALFIPGATILFSRLFRPVMAALLGILGTMAARGVVVSLSRTGVATAALVVAVSATIGVGIMVGSFRLTVEKWLEGWLRADIYVTTVGSGNGRNKTPLDPLLVDRLRQVMAAEKVSLTRRISIESAGAPTDIFAMEIPRATFVSYRFKEGTPEEAWDSFSSGESVVVSEPYAYRHRLHRGDRVTLRTTRGEHDFPISGVFYDYGSDAGTITICRAAYLRYWHDTNIDGMGFYARQGVTSGELAAQIRAKAGESKLSVVSNRELRSAAMEVFDRTFAITGVLRLLTIVVAFVGILSALMAMQVERARELAVLRAVGLTPHQVWGLICGETTLIGTVAGLLSLPLGILQAFVLIYVVNRRSFGWTMEPAIDPVLLLQAVALSLTAALLAGIYPAMAIARTSPALALKEEE